MICHKYYLLNIQFYSILWSWSCNVNLILYLTVFNHSCNDIYSIKSRKENLVIKWAGKFIYWTHFWWRFIFMFTGKICLCSCLCVDYFDEETIRKCSEKWMIWKSWESFSNPEWLNPLTWNLWNKQKNDLLESYFSGIVSIFTTY